MLHRRKHYSNECCFKTLQHNAIMLCNSKEEDNIVETSRIILIYKESVTCDDCVDSVCGNQLLQICHNLLISPPPLPIGWKCEKLQNRNNTKQGTEIRGRKLHSIYCIFNFAIGAIDSVNKFKVVLRTNVNNIHWIFFWYAASWWQSDDDGKGCRAVNVVRKQKMRNGRREK